MFLFRKHKPEPAQYAVECRDVDRTFGSGEGAVRVLRKLDLKVEPGRLVALYGPSGSGKTTLLNLIGALDRPNAGSVFFNGRDITRMGDRQRATLRRTQFGFIFQNYALIPTYTAFENVDLALRLRGLGYFERSRRARKALEVVGLAAWANHVPDELSGGQRQRVAIARALALRPHLMLADEPTAGLDTRTAQRILALFKGIAQTQHSTFLIVSHDPMVAERVDVAYDLHDGQLLPRGTTLALPLPKPEGEALNAETA